MLELDLRLGSVVVRGYSRYNGKAPAIEGQNSPLSHSFLQKAGKWLTNHHRRTNKNFEYNGAPCWKINILSPTQCLGLEIHLLVMTKEIPQVNGLIIELPGEPDLE